MTWIIGDWEVHSDTSTLQCGSDTRPLTPRAMEVLVYLAEHSPETISVEILLKQFWPNPQVGEHAVYKIITELRHALDEDSKQPKYLKTVPKKGYRLQAEQTATDSRLLDQPSFLENSSRRLIAAAGAVIVLVAIFAALVPQGDLTAQITVASIDGKRVAIIAPKTDVPPEMAGEMDLIYRETVMRIGKLQGTSLETIEVSITDDESLATKLTLDHVVSFDYFNKNLIVRIMPGVNNSAHLDRFDIRSMREESNPLVDEVVGRTISDLDVLLSSSHLESMQHFGTQDIHAYRYAHKAMVYMNYLDRAHLLESAELYEQAIASDSHYVDAYLSLSRIYLRLANLASSTLDREELAQATLAIIDKANRANLGDTVLGEMYSHLQLQTEDAHQLEFRWHEQLTDNPHDVVALLRYSKLLSGAGFAAEASRYVDSAVEKIPDPGSAFMTSLIAYTSIASYTDPAEAVRLAKRILINKPTYTLVLYGLVRNNARVGNYIEAEHYLEQLKQTDADGEWAYAGQLILSTLNGELSLNSRALEEAIADPKATNLTRGTAYFVVNDIEKGIKAWRQMEAGLVPRLWPTHASREADFDQRVLDDPRYQALMDDFGLGNRWRGYLLERTRQLSTLTGIPVTTPIEIPELNFDRRFGGLDGRPISQSNLGARL